MFAIIISDILKKAVTSAKYCSKVISFRSSNHLFWIRQIHKAKSKTVDVKITKLS